MRKNRKRYGYVAGLRRVLLFVLVMLALRPQQATAYAVLTHEQLIDLTWQDSIVPLLMSRYPDLTAAQLDEARAYAYGGCAIQDIGYYPYGDRFFSDLTHYVRSGDFIVSLFRNARNANELAFAVGALSHYIGDSVGHPEATNVAVGIEFPELAKKYGPMVNYAQGKRQHVRAEFAFDIDQISHDRVAPLKYLRHVGLKVPIALVSRAYFETYGVRDFDGRQGHRFNVREYRFAIRSFIPRIAYSLTLLHKRHEQREPATPETLEIEREAVATAKLDNWDAYRDKRPGIGTYALAGLIFVLPKVGPLSMLAVKGPTAQTEADYMHSLYLSITALRRSLARFTSPEAARARAAADAASSTVLQAAPSAPLPNDHRIDRSPPNEKLDPRHPLPNRDLDTGHVVLPGGYSLTDDTYATLLHNLTQRPNDAIPPGIQRDILDYYANLDAPITTKRNAAQWTQVLADLKTLAGMSTKPELDPYPTYEDEAADEKVNSDQ